MVVLQEIEIAPHSYGLSQGSKFYPLILTNQWAWNSHYK